MGSSSWSPLSTALLAALLLLLVTSKQHQPQERHSLGPHLLLTLGTDPQPPTGNDDGEGNSSASEGRRKGLSHLEAPSPEAAENSSLGGANLRSRMQVKSPSSNVKAPIKEENLVPRGGQERVLFKDEVAEEESESEDISSQKGDSTTSSSSESSAFRAFPQHAGAAQGLAEAAEESGGVKDSQPFDITAAQRLVETIEEAAAVAASASAALEAALKNVVAHKQQCEDQSKAIQEEIGEPRVSKALISRMHEQGLGSR